MQETGKKSRNRKNAGPVIAALVLIVAASVVFLVQKYMPSGKMMDLTEYFGSLAENEVAVVLQDELADQRAILDDGELYLNYEMVRDDLNSRFYWDEENQQILFTTALETYEIPLDSAEYTVDGKKQQYDHKIIIQNQGAMYMAIDFVQLYTNLDYTLDTETSHVLIRYRWGTQTTASVKKSAAVRYQGGIKSPILTKLEAGDTVTVLEQLDDWDRVVTADGYIGYIRTKRLEDVQETEVIRDFQEEEYTSVRKDGLVNLVWHNIGNMDSNIFLTQDTADMTGVNVISPTWFSLSDNEGNITSLASKDYVKTAHAAGLDIWGLVDNFSADVDTTVLLASTDARRKLIDNLVTQATDLGIEGINLDFEYLQEEDGYSYVQFVRELSVACRKNQLVFSIDVPVPMDFNSFFNRKELGTVADYLIIMGYDEHYAGSDAGSVASLNFEESGIQNTLAQGVPAEKIISGVPFYTRIWYTTDDGTGNNVVSSEILGMTAVENTLESYSVTPVWNDHTQQDYAEWTVDDGTLCQIWIENEASLEKKAQLVPQYSLGGIAEWALGSEKDSVWSVLSDTIGG